MLELIASAALLMAQEHDPNRTIQAIAVRDVVDLMRDLGGTSEAPLRDGADGFLIPVTFSSGLDAVVEGYNCIPEGELTVCREYSIRTELQANDAADAQRIATRLRTIWLYAQARENVVVVGRMDFTHGGVGQGHIGLTFETFEQLATPGLALAAE